MNKFFIPSFKWQLVDWLSNVYPGSRPRFIRMKKNQLMAIYMNKRKEEVL